MPKEIVHWQVAQRAAELLRASPFAPALARCPAALKLGAVYHDVLFYLTGDQPQAMKDLADTLHGANAEDTFALLRAQARHLHARQDSPLPTAFFVGLASHIFADATLHPFVFYHTGNYFDADPARRTVAIRRHRALEALMDMVAAGSPEAARQPSLRQLVNSLEGPLAVACPPRLFAALAGGMAGGMAGGVAGVVDEQAAAKALAAALDTYCTLHGLFRMETLAQIAHGLAPLLPAKAREIAALFYAPQLWEQRGVLSGPLSYRNPVSGEAQRATLGELIEQAAARTAAFCQAQAPAIIRTGELAEHGPGPSLDMGLPAAAATQARHFAPRPLLGE